MKKISNQNKAYLFALLAVLFWSTMSTAFKLTLKHIDFDQLLLWASLFGGIAIFIINQTGKSPIRIKQLSAKDWLWSAIMGFFNPFLYYLVLFKAYDLLEAQVAGTLNYTWPLTLVIMSAIFLKQKISPMSYAAILISFFGILLISTKGSITSFGDANLFGIVLAIGSSIFWASYWIMNIQDSREETAKISLNMFFGFIFIIIYMLTKSTDITLPAGYALLGCVYIGLFEMSITFVIWLLALKYSENTAKVSNLIFLSPFIALIFISYFVNEKIHLATIIGLALIIGGIFLQRFVSVSK